MCNLKEAHTAGPQKKYSTTKNNKKESKGEAAPAEGARLK
jgi:hypothetical protein